MLQREDRQENMRLKTWRQSSLVTKLHVQCKTSNITHELLCKVSADRNGSTPKYKLTAVRSVVTWKQAAEAEIFPCSLSHRQYFKQDRQCKYNVTLGHVRATTVAVEKQ